MAFTREFIRNLAKECGIEMPKEFEDGLIGEHISVRDAYAENEIKKAIEENKPSEPAPVKDSKEYKDLKKKFEDYKAEVTQKEATANKSKAVRSMLKEIGVADKRLDAVMRLYNLDEIELDEEGKIKDMDSRKEHDKEEWGDYIETVQTKGAREITPPSGSSAKTKKEILAISDKAERRAAIAENLELFE